MSKHTGSEADREGSAVDLEFFWREDFWKGGNEQNDDFSVTQTRLVSHHIQW